MYNSYFYLLGLAKPSPPTALLFAPSRSSCFDRSFEYLHTLYRTVTLFGSLLEASHAVPHFITTSVLEVSKSHRLVQQAAPPLFAISATHWWLFASSTKISDRSLSTVPITVFPSFRTISSCAPATHLVASSFQLHILRKHFTARLPLRYCHSYALW